MYERRFRCVFNHPRPPQLSSFLIDVNIIVNIFTSTTCYYICVYFRFVPACSAKFPNFSHEKHDGDNIANTGHWYCTKESNVMLLLSGHFHEQYYCCAVWLYSSWNEWREVTCKNKLWFKLLVCLIESLPLISETKFSFQQIPMEM